MSDEHPPRRWQTALLENEVTIDARLRLRLAAMVGHTKHDSVAARRMALIDLLSDRRPYTREAIWGMLEEKLGGGCWGTRKEETLWRDLQVLRDGGLRIGYSRRPGIEGYYLAYPPIEQPSAFPQQRPDATQIAAIRNMTVAQKNRQAFAAAAFALQQKCLILKRDNPEWGDEQVRAAARQLVFGRHEAP